MENLRGNQEQKPIRHPADGQEAHHAERGARHEQGREQIAAKERRQKDEHRHFSRHAQHPEEADERTAVAEALQVQREKGVQRAVRRGHAEAAREHGKRGAAEQRPHLALRARPRRR